MSADLGVSAGPLRVDPDALDAAATRFAALAGEVADAGRGLAGAALSPSLLASLPLAPVTGARAERSLGALLLGSGGAAAVAAGVLGLSASLRVASLRYRLGEEAAAAVVRLARRAAAEALLEAAPVLAGAAGAAVAADVAYRTGEATDRVLRTALAQVAATGDVDLEALGRSARTDYSQVDDRVAADLAQVGRFVVGHPELVQQIAATTPQLLDATMTRNPELAAAVALLAPEALRADGTVDGVAGVAAVLTSLGAVSPLFRETAVRAEPLGLARAVPSRPPRGVAEVLDGVAHQSTSFPEGGSSLGARMPAAGRPPEGVVRLERVTAADGAVAWIVEIPGTQDWTPLPASTRTPMDLTTNLRAVAGRPTATADAVVQAMRQAGVAAGEPVMLAGHSQGGLTAAALAADPAVRAEFSVTHVVTAGSPVDGIAVPDEVRVLSLEHTGDLVPALDGQAAQGGPSRTVVRRDVGEVPQFAERIAQDPLVAHGWSSYLDTAAVVDASQDPALVAYRRSGSAFFDAPGAVVDVFDYRAVRVP